MCVFFAVLFYWHSIDKNRSTVAKKVQESVAFYCLCNVAVVAVGVVFFLVFFGFLCSGSFNE